MRMGFSGYLIVGRDDRPLPELHSLKQHRQCVTGNRPRADNWQVCSLGPDAGLGDSISLLIEVAAETFEPVLLASFTVGEDGAAVEGFSGPYGYWWTRLTRASCAGDVAGRAVQWATAAGREVEAGPIADLLAARSAPHLEAVFEELLERLGLAGTGDTSPGEIG
ncbi:hypothetical protein J4573_36610 [Actinomadura barringtoniae]|uniref:Uncharacterized protein n=1 Tax=Actinomadura barringtoniae TaxID=1427535 RepID=A0A939T731_9ACTN|nr:hypothetical protein [Actinomadura barringtoniae]MBO2452663.1 hypothetical protein [Actinomadura barringtoniae]